MKRTNIPTDQSIRKLLYDEFLIDLPIMGGSGKSIADAIVFNVTSENDYVGTEYLIIDLLCFYRKVDWQFRQQILFSAGDKKYDCVQITVSDLKDKSTPDWTEAYYFEITDCFYMSKHRLGL